MKIHVHATKENEKNILDLLEEQGVLLPCNCHGSSLCGGKQYNFPCHLIPKHDLSVTIPEVRSMTGLSLASATHRKDILPDTILIDVGTTTIALVFWNSNHKTVFYSEVFSNPQAAYGADVISRIKYDMEFHKEYTLKNLLCDALRLHYQQCISRLNIPHIPICLIGGNTTMIHLLLGLPTDTLARAPFSPSPLADGKLEFIKENTHIRILPWLSAFIGGDIVSGMLDLNFDRRNDTCLLADLGTNGELVLLHRGHLYMTATAAGPAFEGAGLSCGCPATPGAISEVQLSGVLPKTKTIGNKFPTGICGSGAISILSQLITSGLLTPSGVLSDSVPKEGVFIAQSPSVGKIYFTREDIRQMQLATAAIGAGIDTLCHEAGITPQELDTLYLAGGLGYHIDISTAYVTGIFSTTDISHIISVGNSCLLGLASLSFDSGEPQSRIEHFRGNCSEISLADNAYFQEQFIHHLTYEGISTV